MTPRTSIVIPVFNRVAVTYSCLRTLLESGVAGPACEIIVVDDGSRDETPAMLTSWGDRIRVIRQKNRGFSAAINAGAAASRGAELVLLNNDTIPLPGWLSALNAYADAHPEVAMVGGKTIYLNDTIQHAGAVIGQDRYPHCLYTGFPRDHPATSKSRAFQMVTAACALIRRDAFEAANGFDEAFINGYEDVDFCLRLGQMGFAIHYCHTAALYHLESVSDGRHANMPGNTELYDERWLHRVTPDDINYYLEDGLISLTYAHGFPFRLEVSPELANVFVGGGDDALMQLLEDRAYQVRELLGDGMRTLAARADLDFLGRTSSHENPESAAPPQSPRSDGGEHSSEPVVAGLPSGMTWGSLPAGRRPRPLTAGDSALAYEQTVAALRAAGADVHEVMGQAVGGSFEETGLVERQLLIELGLTRDAYLIDVGCGSGRLASALAEYLRGPYLGIDTNPVLLEHARRLVDRPDWRFEVTDGISIPEVDSVADMVCFFSVFTHLLHQQSFSYLREATRVVKPGGTIVVSFLEFLTPKHWHIFDSDVALVGSEGQFPLNMFVERDALRVWAEHLGLRLERFLDGGQTVCVLRTPWVRGS